jgi:ribose-phosphate pyrophosphokinase
MNSRLKIFTGTANPALAQEIANYLSLELSKALVTKFSDGESRVQISNNIRNDDVYVVQPTCSPANEHLMELLLMIDALKRASAGNVTAVIPYYGYARQDRKASPRVPITAKLVANLITAAGADRVITVELHAGQIQGFFDIPTDNLYTGGIFIDHLKNIEGNFTVVSPDAGGVDRAAAYAKRLNASIAIIDKRRDKPNEAHAMNIVGDVNGKDCIIIDDIIDTAGTLTKGAELLIDEGANSVRACITHPVLSGTSIERIKDSVLEEVIVSDSIPLKEKSICKKLKIISLAPLLGEAIIRIHEGSTISALFVH